MRKIAILLCSVFISGCAGVPKDLSPVRDFDVNRYMGTWHEVARLDHSFERGLVNVTAEYSLRPDGGVRVLNKGYDPSAKKWKEAKGRAYFTGDKNTASLKVTFFWPFYGSYNVLELDRSAYSYALVAGPNRSYLWLLSRTPELPAGVMEQLLSRAAALGFDTEKLIYPDLQK